MAKIAGRSPVLVLLDFCSTTLPCLAIVITEGLKQRAYWAGPFDATIEFGPPWTGTHIDFFKNLNYGPGSKYYVSNLNHIQEIYNSRWSIPIPSIEKRIVKTFENIEATKIPYDLAGPNSNSAAFQTIRNIKELPNPTPKLVPYIYVPAWEYNPFDYAPSKKRL